MNLVKNKKTVTARCGLRTNGDIHIGNMLSILKGFTIGKELSNKRKKLKLIIMLVDLEQTENKKPFIYQKDNSGCHSSLAKHSEEIIKSFVSDLQRFYPETKVLFYKVSEFIQIESVKNKILNLYKNNSYKNMISIICEECHHTATISKINNNVIKYSCSFCKANETQFDSVEFAIEHTFLGALENYYFKPDFHIIGRDHGVANKGISNIERGNSYLNKMLQGKRSPEKIFTPLVFGEDNKKMSKSEKTGIFISDLHKKYGKDYIKKVINIAELLSIKKINVITYKEIKKLLEEI